MPRLNYGIQTVTHGKVAREGSASAIAPHCPPPHPCLSHARFQQRCAVLQTRDRAQALAPLLAELRVVQIGKRVHLFDQCV